MPPAERAVRQPRKELWRKWECWIYQQGRAEVRCHGSHIDGYIDGQHYGEMASNTGPGWAMVELERRTEEGWHAARVRFDPDTTWRRTSDGVLTRPTLLLRTAMVVELPTGWAVVDEKLNCLELLDRPTRAIFGVRSTFASEADAVHAAETRLGRWSNVGRDPR